MDLLEAIKRNCLPDYLNITQWIMLMYPDPNNQADFEDVIKKKNLKLDRKIATEKLIQACKNGLPYIGDIDGKVYNWLLNPDPYPLCNNGIYARLEAMRITPELGHWRDNFVKWDVNRCVIHKSVMKPYLISEGKWPVKGILDTWWTDSGLLDAWWANDEQVIAVIGDAGTGKYELYKNSLNALVEKTGINLKVLSVETIFQQVQQTDKELWDIEFTTFKRDIWPIYSEANNLKRQRGRPSKNIK